MCLYPRLVRNPRYKNKEPDDIRKTYVPVPCGECQECRTKKATEWRVRLGAELNTNQTIKFVTLTFNEESLEKMNLGGPNDIASVAIKCFLDRWYQKHKKALKHWLITELGHKNTERLHLHGFLWTNESNEEIEKRWRYGFVRIGEYVNEKSINYMVKYITKIDQDHKDFKGKIFCSKGIGRNKITEHLKYTHRYKAGDTTETIRSGKGYKTGIPTYYRMKIWSEEEREKLWMEKIDKKTRWVGGEKIDISTMEGWKEYHKCLEYYQRKSERNGYRRPEWNAKKYDKKLAKINNFTENCDIETKQP